MPSLAKTADASECADLLSKTLDTLRDLKTAKAAVDAELLTNKDLIGKEETYNASLLDAVKLLVSSEKRNKSFFKKLEEQLGRVLISATEPSNLAAIAGLIVLVRNLK